ncbi:hypothetical protein HPB50_000319 [Hyalomma asiaticum]|uniref:Uncharacterized protein n=1 Tax=Hyalomma asiaticum TaxID=266040 RepID=A0ACB7TCK8_HYAAI|nr:hypothetical protein HPB50_000319 [Hyalomma asiaticum]
MFCMGWTPGSIKTTLQRHLESRHHHCLRLRASTKQSRPHQKRPRRPSSARSARNCVLGISKNVDDAVAAWLKDLRSRNIPVSGSMIQEKAVEFAALFDIAGFDASSGWLHCLRAHYSIAWKQVSGEARSVDTAAASTW